MKRLTQLIKHLFAGVLRITPFDVKAGIAGKIGAAVKAELKRELAVELKRELAVELKRELAVELREMLESSLLTKLRLEIREQVDFRALWAVNRLSTDYLRIASGFLTRISQVLEEITDGPARNVAISELGDEWRAHLRTLAGLSAQVPAAPALADLERELDFLREHSKLLAPVFRMLAGKRVLYPGQCYYYNWYLSRALREIGWQADLLNWDTNPASQLFYHGEDFLVGQPGLQTLEELLEFYLNALYHYDIYHFSNSHGMSFDAELHAWIMRQCGENAEISLLKALGKRVVYTNNGCLDGVSQTAFEKWGPVSVCSICRWRNEPTVCSDKRNLQWGAFRNIIADYQCLLGGNRVDFNDDPRVHEVPEAYCLEPAVWDPTLAIPAAYRLDSSSPNVVRLYHAVGNKEQRTSEDGVNIKCSHIYLPLVEKLKSEGLEVELVMPSGVPNMDVRFLQMQSDIVLEMLTYGWFGTNAREAMMLAKPVICFLRPEWLESLRREIPQYVDELPIISATPETVEEILRDLIGNRQKRLEIGARSREFALKWHSAAAAGRRFDEIYSTLLEGHASCP